MKLFDSRRRGGVTATRFLFVGIILAVFGSLLLAAASPLDLDFVDDEAVDLFARATSNSTGKFVGLSCKSSDECYSKNCEDGICQRQPLGGPCFKGANCATRYCDLSDGSCRDPSRLLGVCGGDNESCSTRANGGQLVCDGNFCKLKDGAACTRDKVCLSGSCGPNKTCVNAGLPPDARCDGDADCQSGKCVYCQETHGFTNCMGDDYFGSFCTRFPLGHTCDVTKQCDVGVCRFGKCSSSKVGDTCVDEFTCTGDQLCSPDKKCILPTTASLKPLEHCASDKQCISQSCTHRKLYRDENGISDLFLEYSDELICAYLSTGQSGCDSTSDCATDLCKSGTCEPAQVGEECDVSYRCAGSSVCGSDGICYNPPAHSVARHSACKSDDDCVSGTTCRTGRTSRLSLDQPRRTIQTIETICQRA
ncbi:hypothetical protein OC835_001300 [Tilletia horrida]|nr:hypothetical protein OC835_001300 [Tilletia horrida]